MNTQKQFVTEGRTYIVAAWIVLQIIVIHHHNSLNYLSYEVSIMRNCDDRAFVPCYGLLFNHDPKFGLNSQIQPDREERRMIHTSNISLVGICKWLVGSSKTNKVDGLTLNLQKASFACTEKFIHEVKTLINI